MTDLLALAERLDSILDPATSFERRVATAPSIVSEAAAALREAHEALRRAEAGMDSYATENQQFYDEIERLRTLLREAVKGQWTIELLDRLRAELGEKHD